MVVCILMENKLNKWRLKCCPIPTMYVFGYKDIFLALEDSYIL